MNLQFENRYAELPAQFHTKMSAEGFPREPRLLHLNPAGAELLGLEAPLDEPQLVRYLSGLENWPGAEPLAMVYAGHQFGYYVPQLGDGRALLLGQVRNPKGQLWDVQLKGSGRTPYSRMGDGRAVVRSCIREYLASEHLHALGIPTTRSLAIVATGSPVRRETVEPGAIFTRLSPSHVRFGHLEFFRHTRQEPDSVKLLLDHFLQWHRPEFVGNYEAFFFDLVRRTARLIARWQAAGFEHGVMNTDNLSLLGITIDYGPYGFMEAYEPEWICNHSDHGGRYAFDQQPSIGLWNLAALGEALVDLIPVDVLRTALESYRAEFQGFYGELMRAKTGVQEDEIWQELLALMRRSRADYSLTFRALSSETEFLRRLPDAQSWWERYVRARRVAPESLLQVNPKYVLRNWVAEDVIRAVEDRDDVEMLERAMRVLTSPFEEHPEAEAWAAPAPACYADLCVSCSS